MRLVLPAVLAGEIAAAAQAAYPRECCGLISGGADAEGFFATALYPARNLAVAAERFDMDPADHIAAAKSARARGSRIIGCYHSHPNGKLEPSPHDFSGAVEEDFLWLIAAVDGVHCQLAGFVYRPPGFVELMLSETVGADLVTSSSNERN